MMLIAGIILLIIGFGWAPFMERFWQPGFFGAPTPTGWRGVMNQIAHAMFFLLLFVAVIRVPLFPLFIALGLSLTVAGIASLLGFSHFPTLLSTGISIVIVGLVVLFRAYRWTLSVTFAETFRGRLPELIRSRRGQPATANTITVFSDQARAVTALQWLPATEIQQEKLIVASADMIYFWTPQESGIVLVGSSLPPSVREVPGFASAEVTDLAVSPDQRYLAASSVDGHIRFFESRLPASTRARGIYSQELLNLSEEQAGLSIDHPGLLHPMASVNTIAWSPALPYRLAFGASDHTVKIWYIGADLFDIRHDRYRRPHQYQMLTYRAHQERVTALAWSPQGDIIASASVDATVHVWNADTGETQCRYEQHQGAVNDLAWSPEGAWIASASDDGSVHVWRALTAEHLLAYHGHDGPIRVVVWSPDGKWIASAGHDHVVRVWDAMRGHTHLTYRRQRKTVLAIAWSSESQRIASGGEDGIVHVWEFGD